ncbi:MAG: formate-dependent phosphoribosylglycinamide formyltransferase [Rhodococcus sp. (in: high G+C Gram-positive bacteria)]|nr:MAG: formate-dependent phosphoribosylglycinamide formyltransferase [Rhodococcus sp. (in: high G+C Gram-positive bacteria)]
MTAPEPVRIGTPLTPGATRVMLLGAGELGKEVIIAFQRLGVEVIAVDRYDNAPGHQVAHHAYTIDMSNPEELLALIDAQQPDFVVPEIEAIATDALAEVEAKGRSVVIPTARATQLTMNREGIRRLAAEELGLPTSPYAFADSLDEVRQALSRKGQSVVRSEADVETAWDYALKGGRVDLGRVIVEGFVDFDYEITLLTVRATNGTSFCEPIGHLQESGDYIESWQPQPMSDAALASAREVAERITTALGGRGLFGVELFVQGDNVYFSEVSPRPHDTGLVTLRTQRFSEFELHARAVLGLPIDTTLLSPGASAVIYGGVDADGISFEGVADALAVPETDLRLFGKPASFVRRRMGVAVSTASDIETARARAREAAGKVRPTV